MARIPLLGGAYTSRSVIASAQEAINLYSEGNPPDGSPPVPATSYPTPGLRLASAPPFIEGMRTLYRASTGALYSVIGPHVYAVSSTLLWTFLGTIPDKSTPVSFSDNGAVIVLVDGSATGYAIDMTNNDFAAISSTNFYGGTSATYQDTYFIFNRPGTDQFYISLSNVTYAMLIGGTAFDPLDIAAKSGVADNIVAAPTVHGELWLIGELTCEVWYNAGAADFPYQRIQGAFIDHGCAAPYSIAQVDISLLWLSQDRQGNCIVVQTEGYSVRRVSVHALEQEWQLYGTISDAIAYVHQIEGHAFYVLTFPSADYTYCYDLGSGQWHRRASIDGNGMLHRHRSNCFAFAYGLNLVGDYQNGNLYEMTNEVFTDNGVPIPRIRRFPHLVQDGNRVIYTSFQADIAAGQIVGGNSADPPPLALRWSDDKGFTYGNALTQTLGATGNYLASPQWSRLGMARDRVFELSWSADTDTALNGCWVETIPCAT